MECLQEEGNERDEGRRSLAMLHGLVLDHVENLEADDHLKCKMRAMLQATPLRAQSSRLFQVFQYVKTHGVFDVSVSTISGPLCSVSTTSSTTVRALKRAIEARTGVPAWGQSLVRHEQLMSDEKTLLEYGVSPVDPAVMLVRMRPHNVYVFGGSGEAKSTAEVLDVNRGVWTSLPSMVNNHQGCAAAASDGHLYVVGGNDDKRGSLSTLASAEAFDVAAGTWYGISPMPVTLQDTTMVALSKKLYVFGGDHVFRSGHGAMAFALFFDIATSSWATLGSIPAMPSKRSSCAAAAVNGKVYIVGGTSSDGRSGLATAEVFDVLANSWASLPAMSTPRKGCAMAASDGTLYVAGGCHETLMQRQTFSSAEAFDIAASSWTHLPPMATPRHHCSMVALEQKVLVFGGFSDNDEQLRSAEILEAPAGSWAALPEMREPRGGCAAAVL